MIDFLAQHHELIEPIHYGQDKKYIGKEHSLQVACYNIFRHQLDRPFVFHPANERKTRTVTSKTGRKFSPEGMRLKAAGVVAGTPDLLINHPRGPYTGLAVEVKTKGDKPSEHQLYVLDWLARDGWYIAVVWNTEGAERLAKGYWSLPKTGKCQPMPIF